MRYLISFSFCLVFMGCPDQGTVVVDEAPSDDSGACVLDADCGLWEKCVQGVCETDLCAGGACENEECLTREDCEAGLVCVEGACVTPPDNCTSSEDCPVGMICDAFTGQCVADPNVTPTDGGVSDGAADGSGTGGTDELDGGSSDGTGSSNDGGSTDGSSNGNSDGSTTGSSGNLTAQETCLGAPLLTGIGGTEEGHYGLQNDYETPDITANWSSGCTGSSISDGNEVVYEIDLDHNEVLTVTVNGDCRNATPPCDPSNSEVIDEVIYLLNTCPSGGLYDDSLNNCVAGAQENYGNYEDEISETMTYTNDTGSAQTYYIVVDAWCHYDTDNVPSYYCPDNDDPFTMEWTIQ